MERLVNEFETATAKATTITEIEHKKIVHIIELYKLLEITQHEYSSRIEIPDFENDVKMANILTLVDLLEFITLYHDQLSEKKKNHLNIGIVNF